MLIMRGEVKCAILFYKNTLLFEFNYNEKLKEIPKFYVETVRKYIEYTNLAAFKDDIVEQLEEFIKNNITKCLEYITVL